MSNFSYEFFLTKENLPSGFVYPDTYSRLAYLKLEEIKPWHYYYSFETLIFHYKGLKDRYPARTLVPFARRSDNDDVACFDGTDTSGNPRVIIIHDWASPGWENHGEFENFLEWLKFAKEQAEEWRMLGGS